MREFHIVDAVVTVPCEFGIAETQSSFTEGVNDFCSFFSEPIPLSQSFKRTPNFHAVKGTAHTQSVKPTPRINTETPRQDSPVKKGVVRQDKTPFPFKIALKPLFDLLMCSTCPLRFLVVDLHRYANDFKEVRAYVFFGCDL